MLLKKIVKRMLRRVRPVRRQIASPPTLGQALVGRTMEEVFRKLGPPPAATLDGPPDLCGAAVPAFWQASTWYYPFDATARTAIAVHFRNCAAHRVETIHLAESR